MYKQKAYYRWHVLVETDSTPCKRAQSAEGIQCVCAETLKVHFKEPAMCAKSHTHETSACHNVCTIAVTVRIKRRVASMCVDNTAIELHQTLGTYSNTRHTQPPKSDEAALTSEAVKSPRGVEQPSKLLLRYRNKSALRSFSLSAQQVHEKRFLRSVATKVCVCVRTEVGQSLRLLEPTPIQEDDLTWHSCSMRTT